MDSETPRKSIADLPSPPAAFDATPASLLSDTNRVINKSREVQDAVVRDIKPEIATFANALLPLVLEENHRLYARQLIEFYAEVSTDEEIRETSREANSLFSRFDTETALRDDLYILLAAARDKAELLDTESQLLLQKTLLGYESNGLGLSGEARDHLRQVNEALKQTEQEFVKDCSNPNGVWYTEDELEGVDNALLDQFERGSGVNLGKVLLKLERMQYFEVIGSARRQETRRLIYSNDAGSAENVALLDKALVLRQNKARLLGFASYAELEMASRMERSPQKIQDFLDNFVAQAAPSRDKYVARLRQLKREDLVSRREHDDGKFYAWDRLFYTKRLLAQDYAFDVKTFSEYFTVEETVLRMLGIFEKVMGLVFVPIEKYGHHAGAQSLGAEHLRWHEDVKVFAVWDDSDIYDDDDNFLGYLYMDLYSRPGKRSGYADLPVRPAFTDADGSRKYTSTCLVCSFAKSTPKKPCLLIHEDVVVLFHELGHGIHDLVAKTRYARFHGASVQDFNEAPSQMLEEWCWCPQILSMLSQHYSSLSPEYMQTWQMEQGGSGKADPPSRALPAELIQKMIRSKPVARVARCMAMVSISLFDLAINTLTSQEAAQSLDTTDLFHSITRSCWTFDRPDGDLPPVHASDPYYIWMEGRYIYLFTQIYAMDMFNSAFRADPMSREQGLRYRRAVIGKGGSEDPMKMLTDFLGRSPKPDAFCEELGLGQTAKATEVS